MFAKLLELMTGMDDLERVASRNNVAELNLYLESRPLLIPKRPKEFLDPHDISAENLVASIERDAEELANDPFEPWVFESNGKQTLPAFSSLKKLEVFSHTISKRLNKIFSLGAGEILIRNVTKVIHIDVVEINPFSERSWQIDLRRS